ncbi:protein FAR-RED IMPAIRED RESPONSE 1-like [Spinacia oleracea]|uniref:Protein FAR-RED IMPAIRED RESPONSE 1-like n=1 Tax=Spinacia oleracea TaxID=3562 RepID=A0A9R0JB61_SPIOL|nr:protein FAR-RED IMPAIRED RESPONSE 1-like [Spinacia oleracea]
MEAAERLDTKTKACGCKFEVKVQRMDFAWKIVKREGHGTHNHSLVVYEEGHRGINGLSPRAKNLIRQMNNAHAKPKVIMPAVQTEYPDDHPNMRHIYNYKDKIRRDANEGRNPAQQFLHLEKEHKYVQWIAVEEGSRAVPHAFVSHPSMVEVLRTYPLVIGMDTTYKTNKYGFPFLEIVGVTPTNQNFLIAYAIMKDETADSYRWVLEKLKMLLGASVSPKAILTDKEPGLLKPVAEVFPNTAHLLCTWHINNDVEARVGKICGNKLNGEYFKNGVWKRIMNATSEAVYNAVVADMEENWSRWSAIMTYVHGTWLKHKEKFVRYETNKVLHFGNRTTCRVESQHSVLKSWLGRSHGALDTVFRKVHAAVENQFIEIKNRLESSRRKHGVKYNGFLFQHLTGRVLHHALHLILEEQKRMWELSVEVYERCGGALLTTHGLPCACTIFTANQCGVGLYIDLIDPFWKTLRIREGANIPQFLEETAQDADHFRVLVDEVLNSDVAVIRGISSLIHDELHREHAGHVKPDPNVSRRGRPPNDRNSTTRNLSHVEHVRRSGSRGRVRGRGRGRVHSEARPTGIYSSSSSFSLGTFTSVDHLAGHFKEQIPNLIYPFLCGFNDVDGDGNCGFRCIAHYGYGDEARHREI